jgi:hypothetical protein
MTSDDWVRILTFLGSGVLFYGSLRGQLWTRTQAKIVNRAPPDSHPVTSVGTPVGRSQNFSAGNKAARDKFKRTAASHAAKPYFDQFAYLILCIGFGITCLASALDMYSHGTLARLGLGRVPIAEACTKREVAPACSSAQ